MDHREFSRREFMKLGDWVALFWSPGVRRRWARVWRARVWGADKGADKDFNFAPLSDTHWGFEGAARL